MLQGRDGGGQRGQVGFVQRGEPVAEPDRARIDRRGDVLPAAVSLFVIITLMHFTIGIRICAPHASIRGILRGPMLWATAPRAPATQS